LGRHLGYGARRSGADDSISVQPGIEDLSGEGRGPGITGGTPVPLWEAAPRRAVNTKSFVAFMGKSLGSSGSSRGSVNTQSEVGQFGRSARMVSRLAAARVGKRRLGTRRSLVSPGDFALRQAADIEKGGNELEVGVLAAGPSALETRSVSLTRGNLHATVTLAEHRAFPTYTASAPPPRCPPKTASSCTLRKHSTCSKPISRSQSHWTSSGARLWPERVAWS